MSIEILEMSDLIVNKPSALRIAKQVFFKKKRITNVSIYSKNHLVTISYTGKRDIENIEAGMEITKVIKRGQ